MNGKKLTAGLRLIITLLFIIFSGSNIKAYSRANVDSLYRVFGQLSLEEKKDAYLEFTSYMVRLDMDSAAQMLDSANRWIQESEFKLKGRFYNILGTYFWYSGNLDTAIYLYKNGLILSKKAHENRQIISNMTNIGAVMNQMGMIDSASHYLNDALVLSDKIDEADLKAKIHFDLGNLNNRKGFNHIALEHLLKSISFYESQKDSLFLVYNYNAIAGTYKNIGDFEKSKYFFDQAIQIDLVRDDVDLLANLYNNLGVTYWKLGMNYDTARYFIRKAISYIPPVDNAVMYELVFKLNLGGIEVDDKNYEEALKLLLQGNKLELPYQDNYKVSALLINLGIAYWHNNRQDSARYYINEGLNLAKSVDAYDNMLNAYNNLYQIDSIQGNYMSAIENYKLRDIVKDSISSESVKNRIAELEIIHETEAKENDNRSLKKQNELQINVINKQKTINTIIIIGISFLLVFVYLLLQNRQKLNKANLNLEYKNQEIKEKNEIINAKNQSLEKHEKELIELNQTKDKFFTIIAHDLKNPFNSLLGLLDILEDDFSNIGDDKKLEIIKKLHQSSRNTYNMLINLLDWSQSQRGYISAELKVISPFEVIKSAELFLKQRLVDKEHQFLNLVDPDVNVYADSRLLQTILINIINNAIKFTQRKGLIKITSQIENSNLVISVIDNGIGLSPEKIDQLFKIDTKLTSVGTEDEKGTGLGLIMCNEFIKLMNGCIEVESELGKGSVFYIKIPLANTESSI